jgi:hypothetical protein
MKKRISTKERADQDRVEGYLRMLDRILLYNMAVNTLPPHALKGIVKLWDKVVMKSIDLDASMRTEYLEGTKIGRLSKLQQEPDGEQLRLHCLEQLHIAREVIENNLLKPRIVDELDDDYDDN